MNEYTWGLYDVKINNVETKVNECC